MAEINIGTRTISEVDTAFLLHRFNIESLRKPARENTLWAYTDGSFTGDNLAYASSVMLIQKHNESDLPQIIVETKPAPPGYSSIQAEVNGVSLAIREALTQNFQNLVIFHDLDSLNPDIVNDAVRNNKNHELYSYYQQIESISKEINILFMKVTGHKNPYNNIVDTVAHGNANRLRDQLVELKLSSNVPQKIIEPHFDNSEKSSITQILERFPVGSVARKAIYFSGKSKRNVTSIRNNLANTFKNIQLPQSSKTNTQFVTNSLIVYLEIFGINSNKINFGYDENSKYITRKQWQASLKQIHEIICDHQKRA